jgi:hypothetical protein
MMPTAIACQQNDADYMPIPGVAPNLWTAIQAAHVARVQQFRASVLLAWRLQPTLQLALRLPVVAGGSCVASIPGRQASQASQVSLALKVLQVCQDHGCGGIAGARRATNIGHFLCRSSVVPSKLAVYWACSASVLAGQGVSMQGLLPIWDAGQITLSRMSETPDTPL